MLLHFRSFTPYTTGLNGFPRFIAAMQNCRHESSVFYVSMDFYVYSNTPPVELFIVFLMNYHFVIVIPVFNFFDMR
jgi:hypothetical protein